MRDLKKINRKTNINKRNLKSKCNCKHKTMRKKMRGGADILFQGWLTKLPFSNTYGNSKNRYFVLYNDYRLSYFEDSEKTFYLGTLFLSNYIHSGSITIDELKLKLPKYYFKYYFTLKDKFLFFLTLSNFKHPLILAALNEKNRDDWLKKIYDNRPPRMHLNISIERLEGEDDNDFYTRGHIKRDEERQKIINNTLNEYIRKGIKWAIMEKDLKDKLKDGSLKEGTEEVFDIRREIYKLFIEYKQKINEYNKDKDKLIPILKKGEVAPQNPGEKFYEARTSRNKLTFGNTLKLGGRLYKKNKTRNKQYYRNKK